MAQLFLTCQFCGEPGIPLGEEPDRESGDDVFFECIECGEETGIKKYDLEYYRSELHLGFNVDVKDGMSGKRIELEGETIAYALNENQVDLVLSNLDDALDLGNMGEEN